MLSGQLQRRRANAITPWRLLQAAITVSLLLLVLARYLLVHSAGRQTKEMDGVEKRVSSLGAAGPRSIMNAQGLEGRMDQAERDLDVPGRARPRGSRNSHQGLPPPFRPDYLSRLSKAALNYNIEVPDLYRRQRLEAEASGDSSTTGKYGPCPPHDLDENGKRVLSMDLAGNLSLAMGKQAGDGWWDANDPLGRPSLDALSRITIGLVGLIQFSIDSQQFNSLLVPRWLTGFGRRCCSLSQCAAGARKTTRSGLWL
jgi:hypothetical protein